MALKEGKEHNTTPSIKLRCIRNIKANLAATYLNSLFLKSGKT